jgi:ABC-type methionine transport system ATPase subunit
MTHLSHLRFHVRFPEDKVKEPIIYQIGREYNVVTNVRRADVRETTGWVDVELSGETAEVERAVAGLRAKGCSVDPIELNVVE